MVDLPWALSRIGSIRRNRPYRRCKSNGKRYLIGQNVLEFPMILSSRPRPDKVELPGGYTLYLSVSSKKENANYTLELNLWELCVSVYYDHLGATETVTLSCFVEDGEATI